MWKAHWELPDQATLEAMAERLEDPGITATPRRFPWLELSGLVAVAIAIAAAGWIGFNAGWERGYLTGWNEKGQAATHETQRFTPPPE